MSRKPSNPTFLASLGAGLEYYDFVIYGMMAEYLGPLFFAGSAPWVATVKAFAVFAVGYFTRPLGGLFFGMVGDVWGRKKTFVSVMLLMALSTLAIGLIPTSNSFPIVAPLLLLFFRLLQGVSFGAELPCAITVVCEFAEKKGQGRDCGFVVSSVGIGSALGSLVLFMHTFFFTREEMLAFGWRLPFVIGGVLAIASYFIRSRLEETPEFKPQHSGFFGPVSQLLKEHKLSIILGMGRTLLASSLVIFTLYLPAYVSSSQNVYFAMTMGMLWSAFCLPLAGKVADHFGFERVLQTVSIAFTVLVPFLFMLLKAGHVLTFVLLCQTMIAFASASLLPSLASSFPTHVRFTGVGLCYNLTYSLMALSPMLYTASPAIIPWFLGFGGILTALSASQTKAVVRFRRQVA